MKISQNDFLKLSEIAILAAREAGEIIQSYFGKVFDIKEKKTGASEASQILTEVDLLSQDILLKHLKPTCEKYDLGMLTEELPDDGSRFEKDFFWCIDPLDGTLPFTESRPGYGVSIALVAKSGEPVMGVVYDPANHNLYHAIKGLGAFRNEKPWSLKPKSCKGFNLIGFGGAVMNASWALEQAPALFYKKPKPELGGGCLWDYAATACIYSELGAWVSDIHGAPLDLNSKISIYMNQKGVLFSTDSDLAKSLFI